MSMPDQTGVYLMPPTWVADLPYPAGESTHGETVDLNTAAEVIAQVDITDGVVAHAHRDGLVMFEVSPKHSEFSGDGADVFPALSARTALVNTFQAVFRGASSMTIEKVPVTHRSLVHADAGGDNTVCYRANEELVRYLYAVPKRKVIGSALGTWVHVNDAWVVSRHQYQPRYFEQALEGVAEIYAKGGSKALRRYEVLFSACAALESRDSDTALVLGFALCEYGAYQLLDEIADELRADGCTIPDDPTKVNMKAAIKHLRRSGRVPDPLCRELEEYRNIRNDWAHRLEPVSRNTAERCIGLAGWLMAAADRTSFLVTLRSAFSGVAL